MTFDRSGLRLLAACAAIAGLIAAPVVTQAQATTPKPAARSAKPTKKAVVPKAVEFTVPAASAEQVDAAERVYYGVYDCEFNQTIQIVASAKHPAYVDIKHGKAVYLMKPVLSSTGAIRLEDVRGETLMVQISAKSMLLNVKTARRLVDDCISPKQRELNEAARAAKAEAVAAAAAASAAAATPASAASGAAPMPVPMPMPATASAAPPAAASAAASSASGTDTDTGTGTAAPK